MSDLSHIAFYKFVHLTQPEAVVERLRALTHDLRGSILIAHEGINGMLAGTSEQLDGFEAAVLLVLNFWETYARSGLACSVDAGTQALRVKFSHICILYLI